MKIAVTGASGFIGRYVLAELIRLQAEVIAVSRDVASLASLDADIRVVEMDIAFPGEDCFDRLGRPDVLIHLAWDGLPNYKSLHHFETELPRQYHFLKTMIEAGLSSLLATGTCFEYGMQFGPLSEGMVTLPVNPYGLAKDVLRRQLEFLRAVKPYNLTWARLFYLYGEGKRRVRFICRLKKRCCEGKGCLRCPAASNFATTFPLVMRHSGSLHWQCVDAMQGKSISVAENLFPCANWWKDGYRKMAGRLNLTLATILTQTMSRWLFGVTGNVWILFWSNHEIS